MPTITFRVTEQERTTMETAAANSGATVSDYIRETMRLRAAHPDLAETIRTLIERSNHAIVVGTMVDGHERRLKQLEQVAGLD